MLAKHVVHLARGVTLRLGETNGVSETQCGRAGRYRGYNSLTMAYLTGLPMEFIRQVAGFGLRGGHYFIARATLEPQASLIDDVFPFVAQLEARVGTLGMDAAHERTCRGFIDLLNYLAKVMLIARALE